MMSTVVVVRKEGWAVIGADSMTKFGDTNQSAEYIKNFSKIAKIGDSYLGYVGSATFSMILASYFSKLKRIPSFNSPLDIFETFREMHKSLKEDYFLRPEEEEDDEFESSRVDLLIANPMGIFGLYALRSVDEYHKFYAFGTGYRFALGAMKTLYDTTASAEEIARAGLEAAAEFDDSTGRPFEVYTVKLDFR